MIMSEWNWELFWFSGQGSFLWGGDIWKRDVNEVREQMMWRYEEEQFKQREQWRLKKENKLEVLEEPGWLEHSESGEIGKAGLARSCWTLKAKKKTL